MCNQKTHSEMNAVKGFFREVLNAWLARTRCNVVPAEHAQELFNELSFHPSNKQIGEIMKTAKILAHKGCRQPNGLTFGEICVLAAELKRFRAVPMQVSSSSVNRKSFLGAQQNDFHEIEVGSIASKHDRRHWIPPTHDIKKVMTSAGFHQNTEQTYKSEKWTTARINSQTPKKLSDTAPVEVFLGGSCNPTTWRADVAIPALKKSGISFYNPQVSDWTPDLIELEHRAKEKARVLFFVMDSETRASAGAIEAAHIAGQNCKQLVLVLHPYKPYQYILDEPISQQEYVDLTRNQMILKEIVTRRGVPVLDNIPSALQRTKEILAGFREPPSNIASILVAVRGAFNRVNPRNGIISMEQCQKALLYLGYTQSLVSLHNINAIILSHRETLDTLCKHAKMSMPNNTSSSNNTFLSCPSIFHANCSILSTSLDFELFCVVSAYLSVYQQEMDESGCISPIKGTNVPPPAVYLSTLQGDENLPMNFPQGPPKLSRSFSNPSALENTYEEEQGQLRNHLIHREYKTEISSNLPRHSNSAEQLCAIRKTPMLQNIQSVGKTTEPTSKAQKNSACKFSIDSSRAAATSQTPEAMVANVWSSFLSTQEEDSNSSVFSSNTSTDTISWKSYSKGFAYSSLDLRDVYLGGSCALRTKWRQEIAMPYLKTKNITFHLPSLQESIQSCQKTFTVPEMGEAKSFVRTRRKHRYVHNEEVEDTVAEESLSLSLSSYAEQNLFNPFLIDASRVLLFVITDETRSLAPMTLAAYCIGLMYNIVLSVQMLPENCIIGNERLTATAIKDYNRGRSYLIDLAERHGVPVFSNINEALLCTVKKVEGCGSRKARCKF